MYEFTFLIEDVKALKPLEKTLESFDGKKLNEENWGKRLLSYPIEKATAAEYFTWHIQLDKHKLDEFKKKLNYDTIVMRYLILNTDHAPKATQKRKAAEAAPVTEPEKTV
jgi:small subunit ribosomal protein S6